MINIKSGVKMAKKKTLKTFLKNYCKEITDSKDYRLSSFISALDNNPRAEGPLILYAAVYFPEEKWVFDRLNKKQQKTYTRVINSLKNFVDMDSFIKKLPVEQRKAVIAYYDYVNENKSDNSLKKAYHKRILELLKKKGISKYKICKENSINMGNFHAFIHGAYDRLSLKKCDIIYNYLL